MDEDFKNAIYVLALLLIFVLLIRYLMIPSGTVMTPEEFNLWLKSCNETNPCSMI